MIITLIKSYFGAVHNFFEMFDPSISPCQPFYLRDYWSHEFFKGEIEILLLL